MENTLYTRKLIDIKKPVMQLLSAKAELSGVSLKKYIETLIEQDALRAGRDSKLSNIHSRKVLSLVGVGHLKDGRSAHPEDDRLQYILSK